MSTRVDIGQTSGGVGTSRTIVSTNWTFNNESEATNYEIINSFSPIFVQPMLLSAGFNLITLPIAPRVPGGVIIVMQPEATYGNTLKGVTGDTGIALHFTAPTVLTFPVTGFSTTFGLTWGGLGKNAVSVTADSTTEKITLSTHGLLNGDRVTFGGTTLPGGVTSGIWYYVVNKSTNDFQLSLTANGSVIDITSNGSGVTVTTADLAKLYWF